MTNRNEIRIATGKSKSEFNIFDIYYSKGRGLFLTCKVGIVEDLGGFESVTTSPFADTSYRIKIADMTRKSQKRIDLAGDALRENYKAINEAYSLGNKARIEEILREAIQ